MMVTSTSENPPSGTLDVEQKEEGKLSNEMNTLNLNVDNPKLHHEKEVEVLNPQIHEWSEEANQTTEDVLVEKKEADPVFDGTEGPELEATRSLSGHSLDLDPGAQAYAWPEKAVALKNFVKERGAVAVSSVLRRLSSKKDEDEQIIPDGEGNNDNLAKDNEEEAKAKGAS